RKKGAGGIRSFGPADLVGLRGWRESATRAAHGEKAAGTLRPAGGEKRIPPRTVADSGRVKNSRGADGSGFGRAVSVFTFRKPGSGCGKGTRAAERPSGR